MNYPIEVVCALIWNGNKIFSAKRRVDQFPPDCWEFPGGKIEPNETPFNAIRREIHEELHMMITPTETLSYFDHDYGKFTIRLVPVICETYQTDFHIKEHADAGWFSPNECRELVWAPADVPILEKYVYPRGL